MEHGFNLEFRCREKIAGGRERGCECGGEAVANIVVYSDFAYPCALKYMVPKLVRAASAAAEGFGSVVEDG